MCVFCILDSQMQSTFNHTPKKKNYYLHSSLCNLMLSKCGILIILIIIIWHRTMYDCFYLFIFCFSSRACPIQLLRLKTQLRLLSLICLFSFFATRLIVCMEKWKILYFFFGGIINQLFSPCGNRFHSLASHQFGVEERNSNVTSHRANALISWKNN